MLLVGVTFFVMGSTIAAAAWTSGRRHERGDLVRHAQAVLTQTERAGARLYAAQTEAQDREGRLQRAHDAALESALREARTELDRLERLTVSNPVHRARVRSLQDSWRRYERAARRSASAPATADPFRRALRSLRAMRLNEEEILRNCQTELLRSIRAFEITLMAAAGAMALAFSVLVGLVAREVAARRREDTAVRETMDGLRDLSIRIPVAAIHVEGERLRLNEAAARLTGYGDDEIGTLDAWFRLMYGGRARSVREAYEAERREGFAQTSRHPLRRKDGAARDVEFAGYAGDVGEVWIFRDVTEELAVRAGLEEANRVLSDLASTDPLTGLRNRRAFGEAAEAAFATAAETGQPLSAVMLDVDHFKSVNDRFGHEAGDAALRLVARLLSWEAREGDVAARYGGEEFVVLLPGTGLEAALEAAERMRQAVADAVFGHGRTTVSVGVATLTPAVGSMEALLQDADAALYDAKRSGRNRACVGGAERRAG